MPNLEVALFALVIGATIGSFLNVLILRYSKQPITGRSQCPNCNEVLRWHELLPIASFIIQRGHCRSCHKKISIQYPIVELSMGIAAVLLFSPSPNTANGFTLTALSAIIVALLIVLFVIDLRTFLLPDIYVGILAGVVVLHLFLETANIISATAGAAIGAGFLGLLWLITSGRGIGLGDVKLMLPLGALFGPATTALLLLSAFIAGGLVATWLLAKGQANMKTPVPFGPFLAGVAILFILAPQIPATLLTQLFFL